MRTIVYYLLQVRCRQARPTNCHVTTNTANTARRAGSFRFNRPILGYILQLCVPPGAHTSARLAGKNSTIVAIPPLCNTADATRTARFHPISSRRYTQLQDTVQNSPLFAPPPSRTTQPSQASYTKTQIKTVSERISDAKRVCDHSSPRKARDWRDANSSSSNASARSAFARAAAIASTRRANQRHHGRFPGADEIPACRGARHP